MLPSLVAAAAAFVLSVAGCRLVIGAGPVDAPTEARKIQTRAVPTSGGLAFGIAALLCAFVASGQVDWKFDDRFAGLGVAALVLLATGFVDDVRGLKPRPKLLLQLAGCAIAVGAGLRVDAMAVGGDAPVALPAVIAVGGSLLWLVVCVNATNFMDGANGLAMGMACVAAAGLAACATIAGQRDIALAALALVGALAGFLVWNIPGRLFAGDAGALCVGVLLGGLGLLLVRADPNLLFVPPTLMSTFLVDVLLTLVWRSRRGLNLFEAHRDHAYQIAMKVGLSHGKVALVHAVLAANAAALAIVATLAGGWTPLAAFVIITLANTALHMRLRRIGEKGGLVSRPG